MRNAAIFSVVLAAAFLLTGSFAAAEPTAATPRHSTSSSGQILLADDRSFGFNIQIGPRHDRRFRYEGYDLVWDDALGCYTVVGYPDYYYRDGNFFRFYNGDWFLSAHLGGGRSHWVRTYENRLPRPLFERYHDRYRGGERGHYRHNRDHERGQDRHNDRDYRDHHDYRR